MKKLIKFDRLWSIKFGFPEPGEETFKTREVIVSCNDMPSAIAAVEDLYRSEGRMIFVSSTWYAGPVPAEILIVADTGRDDPE